ncbi:SHOCT domain-containing protein [Virgibacillus halodenitrificans]|uniref:SHOCT domain-containing protein n=1 Tax=Virgibacillus halodenitrificans TaxID=1482 RepID=UPI001FB49F18|nr:SHOCT domain-containing protein [Virgibacillus halodenitrificans]MCJ0932965.1 SHOCT domain-containing protein [Virgibacillus halodenitrificans]
MRSIKDLKAELKPIGKINLMNFGKEVIESLSNILFDDEIIQECAVANDKMTNSLVIITNSRLIIIKKPFKGITQEIYEKGEIKSVKVNEKPTTATMILDFILINGEKRVKLNLNKQSRKFTEYITSQFHLDVTQEINRQSKIKIEILNGQKDLGFYGSKYEIAQEKPGEISFIVDNQKRDNVFQFIKYEKTENIKKSALDVAGWTFAGNMLWGKTGALAGGLSAQAGKDNSTAALFLVDKKTNKNIMLIIKCDSKILGKLSLIIPAQEDFQEVENQPTSDKYEQLTQIADLKEQGILTEEEFQQEKTKILNQ